MEKLFIKNRKGEEISVLIETVKNPRGLIFVLHGTGGIKENDPMATFARVFLDNNYNVVRFDATNTFGESYGQHDDMTFDSFYEDLEDVVKWSKQQDFYLEPFIISAYSLSAMCSLYFTQNHPSLVKALVLISAVFDGETFIKKYSPKELLDWEKTGIRIWLSKYGYEKRLKYSYIESMKKTDVFKGVSKIKVPVILLNGDIDDTTPLKDQKIFFEALSCDKELHVIDGVGHSFRSKDHSSKIYNILNEWIKKLK
ncbi:MAG: alpha/beta fold hydrolase [Patescibacteria group bacterium]|nr:alpha/beta fold hydrolase [Patescibacteria group bacterium]